MKFGKVLFGVGLGVLAGLLFAPKKGSELREDIKAKSKSTYDYLANLTREDVEAKLGETIENIKKSVDEFDPDDFKETTKEKVDEVQKKLEILAEKVKSSDNFDKVKGSVVEVTGRVNKKIDEVKTMINDKAATIDEDTIDQEIDDVEKDTYFASLVLTKDGEEPIEIDCRPSDAIAVAIRVEAPIYVASSVLATGAVSTDPSKDEEEAQEFKNFVQNLKPSDFEKLLKGHEESDQ